MMDRTFWFEVDEDAAMRGLDAAHVIASKSLRNALDNLADAGIRVLEANVPIYTTYTLRHVDRTEARWRPGGAGGGGHWEVILGIKSGTSKHPLYADKGTGIYGESGLPYTGKRTELVTYGRTTSVSVPSRMYFFSQRYGRVIGVREVEGQKPQRFLYRSFAQLQVYAKLQLSR